MEPLRADGKNVLVTGGNAGIGYFVCEQLAAAGASVLLGARSAGRAEAAVAAIRGRVAGADVRHVPLDLGDAGSLKAVADRVERLDAVVHNAGVYVDGDERQVTADGNELMFATNHLGHFALTHWLLPKMADGGRVVVTGSLTARSVRLDFDDLQTKRDYKTSTAYARSKLAQMMFGFELDRRGVDCVVVHPGGALDSLTPARPNVTSAPKIWAAPARVLVQGKDAGAWSTVRAVLDPGVLGGQLIGPRGPFGAKGKPRVERPRPHFTDPAAAKQLWDATVELTGLDLGLK